MAQVLKPQQVRYPGQGRLTGIILSPETMEQTDQLRGDIPRSKWVERALVMYNGSVMKEHSECCNNKKVKALGGGIKTSK